MRLGARRGRAAQLRRAAAESEIALRRAQQNHGPRRERRTEIASHATRRRRRKLEKTALLVLRRCYLLTVPMYPIRADNLHILFYRDLRH